MPVDLLSEDSTISIMNKDDVRLGKTLVEVSGRFLQLFCFLFLLDAEIIKWLSATFLH